jgi:hypothetical protein
MSARLTVSGLGVAALISFLPGASIAAAQEPIGPGQHFIGLVNGSNTNVQVFVVCPGPVGGGRTGPVAGGQTMAVARTANGKGYTGLFSQVYAWFVPATSGGAAPPALKFTEYGQPQSIPTSFRVPCSGKGRVEFSSCPYLAPCAAGWVPDYVSVRFVDIAA